MQKTTLADALLGGANATGSLIPQFGNAKGVEQAQSEFSFTQAMNDTAWMQSEKPSNDVKDELLMKKTVEVTKPNREVKSSETNQPKNNKPLNGEQKTEAVKAVDEGASKVADKIKEQFGVTDEQLEEAMEVLGIELQDLFNVADIQKLIGQLEGVTDSVEFLTNVELYDSFKEVINFAEDIKGNLLTELNVTDEVFNELIDDSQFAEILKESGVVDSEVTVSSDNLNNNVEAVDNTDSKAGNEALTVEINKTEAEDKEISVKATDEDLSEINTDENVTVLNSKTETFKNVTKLPEKNNSNSNASENENAGQLQSFQQIEITNADGTQTIETVETYVSRADTENIMRQVTDYIKVNVSQDVSSVEMMLHPASLGMVNMQLSAQNGAITAHLTVQDELVKAVLESQLVELEKTFLEQGTKVEAIEVSVGNFNLDASTSNDMADNSQNEREGSSSKNHRKSLNLNEIGSFDELDEEDRIEAEMMEMNGSSVNYQA